LIFWDLVTVEDFPFHVPATGRTGWISEVMSPLRDAQHHHSETALTV
jgi:hypothetical protein